MVNGLRIERRTAVRGDFLTRAVTCSIVVCSLGLCIQPGQRRVEEDLVRQQPVDHNAVYGDEIILDVDLA